MASRMGVLLTDCVWSPGRPAGGLRPPLFPRGTWALGGHVLVPGPVSAAHTCFHTDFSVIAAACPREGPERATRQAGLEGNAGLYPKSIWSSSDVRLGVWVSHTDASAIRLTFASPASLRAPVERVDAQSPNGLLPCQALGDSQNGEAYLCPRELAVQGERGEDSAGACIVRKGSA